MTLYDLSLRLIGDLPQSLCWIHGIFCVTFIVALLIMCLFPVVFIFKIFK